MELDNQILQFQQCHHHHNVDTAINLTLINSPRFRLLWSIKNFSALDIECGSSLSVNFDWEYRNTKWRVHLFPNGHRQPSHSSDIIGFITILEIGDKSEDCVPLKCKMGIVNQDCEYIKVSLKDVKFKPNPKRANSTFAVFELIDKESIFANENIYLKNDELLLSIELIVPVNIGSNTHRLVYPKSIAEHLLYAVPSKALLNDYKKKDLPPLVSDEEFQKIARMFAYAKYYQFGICYIDLHLRNMVDSLSSNERNILETELKLMVQKYSHNNERQKYILSIRNAYNVNLH